MIFIEVLNLWHLQLQIGHCSKDIVTTLLLSVGSYLMEH